MALKASQRERLAALVAARRTADPAVTVEAVTTDLNGMTETRAREIIPAWEILDAIDPSERAKLDDAATVDAAARRLFDNFISAREINILRPNTRQFFRSVFTAAAFPLTRANLGALMTEPASPADNAGLPHIRIGWVMEVWNG